MKVALTVNDFLRRAEQIHPHREAIVDEPVQPAESWGAITYAEMAARARAQAAALDAMGVGAGERVAIVSHNSARLLTALFGVSGSGRVLVPINFRLVAEEVKYIVEHSGARVLMVDPELDEALADVHCERRYVIGDTPHIRLHDVGLVEGRCEDRHQWTRIGVGCPHRGVREFRSHAAPSFPHEPSRAARSGKPAFKHWRACSPSETTV